MRTIIAGSRGITSMYLIERAVQESGFSVSEVVSGAAEGVDTLGEKWARRNRIEIKQFPADWEGHPERHITKNGHSYDPIAGLERDKAMAEYADCAIVIWDGKSTGSKHMIETMRALGKPVRVLQQIKHEENPL